MKNTKHIISLKLAKQLKDVGFTQEGDGEMVKYDCEMKEQFLIAENTGVEDIYIPTLSELIEECGEEFDELVRLSEEWIARGNYSNNDGIKVFAKTPEEAVAKLYLKLNDKQTKTKE